MSARRTIIFLGTPVFAAECLAALARDPRFEVLLAVSQPDKPVGRKQELMPTPVKAKALELGIPVFQPQSANKELIGYLNDHGIARPDFLAVVAYGKILNQAILDLPLIAPVNVHASLLPRWRGASPIEHAILGGDTETGLAIQRMVLELDAGPVLAEERTLIDPEETAVALRERLMHMAARLLPQTLAHPLTETPQDAGKATFCGKLSREDGMVNPSAMSAEEIHRKVRGLVPWPGVVCTVEGQSLKLLHTSLSPHATSYPLSCNNHTTLHLLSVQQPGKRAVSGKDFGNGLRNKGAGK
jgi:methionyl-tRNA formyltransferase